MCVHVCVHVGVYVCVLCVFMYVCYLSIDMCLSLSHFQLGRQKIKNAWLLY
jgi:hypothetical protein